MTMNSSTTVDHELLLETTLNQFPLAERRQALLELAGLLNKGTVPLEPEKEAANMHCHTFYSFNAYGYSPAGLAWIS